MIGLERYEILNVVLVDTSSVTAEPSCGTLTEVALRFRYGSPAACFSVIVAVLVPEVVAVICCIRSEIVVFSEAVSVSTNWNFFVAPGSLGDS